MEKFLPIGSIVLLKGGRSRLMICGRQHRAASGRLYDYIAYIYPFGYVDKEKIFMFNADRIEKVYYVGYQDAIELEYKEILKAKAESEEKENED